MASSVRKQFEELAEWAAGFDGYFPDADEDGVFNIPHWHFPVEKELVDPPEAEQANQTRAMQMLLDAAAAVRRARPDSRAYERVYVLISWPEPSDSQFGVFTDVEYGRDFERRDNKYQTWTPIEAENRSLARELGLQIPEGFAEAGYHARDWEEDPDHPDGERVFEREVWMIREPVPGS